MLLKLSLFVALTLFSPFIGLIQAQSQNRVEILKAQELEPGSPEYTIAGRFFAPDVGKTTAIQIQVAVRAPGLTTWAIQGSKALMNVPKAAKWTNWSVSNIRLGAQGDERKQFQVMAFAVPDQGFHLVSPLDYDSLVRSALFVSEILKVTRGSCLSCDPPPVKPQILIKQIGDHKVDVRNIKPYPVRLEEDVKGDVKKPENTFVQIIVQPLTGDGRWVMHGGNVGKNNVWDSNAYFGREGLDAWEVFLVYAVISKVRLPATRIEPAQWEALQRSKTLLAESPQVTVLRIEYPYEARKQTRIEITRINIQRVDDVGEWTGTKLSAIEGRLIGRPITTGERVWVLVRPNNEEGTWRNIGQAVPVIGLPSSAITGASGAGEEHYWELPPVFIGNAGQRIKMVAVLASKKILDLDNDDEKRFILAQSKAIKLKIGDESPVEITAIDNRQITDNSEVIVPRLAPVSGALASRFGSSDEKVWIYVRAASGEGTWRLIGAAIRKSAQSWELAPSVLGDSGERLLVIAVLSTTRMPTLDDTALQSIKASPHVKVRIE